MDETCSSLVRHGALRDGGCPFCFSVCVLLLADVPSEPSVLDATDLSVIGLFLFCFVIQIGLIGDVKQELLEVRVNSDMTALVDDAVKSTGLSRSEGLRKGVPEVVRALEGPPKKNLVAALLDMKGLEIPLRHYPMKRRV